MPTDDGNKGLPIPFITAVWSGMPMADIEAGLANGSILPPMGAPAGWSPSQPMGTATATAKPARLDEATPAATTGTATRDQVQGWLVAIDPALGDDAFASIWERAGTNDGERGIALQRQLGTAFLGDPAANAPAIDAFVAAPGHRATVVDLSAMTGAELATLASTDIGYRQALATFQPFAFTGNRALFAQANADGALDRFDPDTGEANISDAWLSDRAKMFAWTAQGDDARAISGTQDWTFIDRSTTNAAGEFATVELATGAEGAGKNQVVFGNDDSELLQGVSGSDRMYGGLGDDVLRGGAGGDHLEGGRGDDLVMGGAGNDELAGNQGDDELEGGRGNDQLAGGAGADTLTGGRGSDVLEGGSGVDTYVFDSGDGADTIVDADGLGAIEIDGTTVGGAISASGNGTWASADGQLSFSFTGSPDEAGTLTIRSGTAADSSGSGDVISVRNWKNGDLGITLAVSTADNSAGGPNFDLSALDGLGVPLYTAADLDPDLQLPNDASDMAEASETPVNDGISWGDNAPVGVSSGAAGSGAIAAELSDAVVADAGTAYAGAESPSSVPELDETGMDGIASLDSGTEYQDAIAAIFGSDTSALSGYTSVSPSDVVSALDGFDGVLEAPDVTFASADVSSDFDSVNTVDMAGAANALTLSDYADALADAYDAEDFAGEVTFGAAPTLLQAPDVKSSQLLAGTTPSVVKEDFASI